MLQLLKKLMPLICSARSLRLWSSYWTIYILVLHLHTKPQLQLSHPLPSPSVSLHVRRSSCVEVTGFSQRYDIFGSLFSAFFHPSRQTLQSFTALPHILSSRRDTHQVILLFEFSPNRSIGECFVSAEGFFFFFWRALHINSKKPALLSHMVQHPLINATLCCVTKSQLHHAFLWLICFDSSGWHLNQQPPKPSLGINGGGYRGWVGWRGVTGALI